MPSTLRLIKQTVQLAPPTSSRGCIPTEDRLELYCTERPSGARTSVSFYQRGSEQDPWGQGMPIREAVAGTINSGSSERDTFVLPDGLTLYYASDRAQSTRSCGVVTSPPPVHSMPGSQAMTPAAVVVFAGRPSGFSVAV